MSKKEKMVLKDTAKNPQACTVPNHNGHGEPQVNEPVEEEKGAEEASTLSSLGVSTVQCPQPERRSQLIPPPMRSFYQYIRLGQTLNKKDFDRLLFDSDTLEWNDEEDLRGYDGETYQEGFALAKPPETIGVIQTAYASDGTIE